MRKNSVLSVFKFIIFPKRAWSEAEKAYASCTDIKDDNSALNMLSLFSGIASLAAFIVNLHFTKERGDSGMETALRIAVITFVQFFVCRDNLFGHDTVLYYRDVCPVGIFTIHSNTVVVHCIYRMGRSQAVPQRNGKCTGTIYSFYFDYDASIAGHNRNIVETTYETNMNNQQIGKVLQVEEGLAHNNLRIELNNGKKCLVPYVKAFIHKVDLEQQKIWIKTIEGLL